MMVFIAGDQFAVVYKVLNGNAPVAGNTLYVCAD